MKSKTRLAIFASGGGSNARRIIEYFDGHPAIEVAWLYSNKKDSGVPAISESFGMPHLIFSKKEFYDTDIVLESLKNNKIDLIILAGFLLLVPLKLIRAFPDKIINIHPALLPKYGGKGMYGHYVHEAVKAAGEIESGMSIHLVNENFDDGPVLFREKCSISENDTPDEIAAKVLKLEHKNYAPVIEKYALEKFGKR